MRGEAAGRKPKLMIQCSPKHSKSLILQVFREVIAKPQAEQQGSRDPPAIFDCVCGWGSYYTTKTNWKTPQSLTKSSDFQFGFLSIFTNPSPYRAFESINYPPFSSPRSAGCIEHGSLPAFKHYFFCIFLFKALDFFKRLC